MTCKPLPQEVKAVARQLAKRHISAIQMSVAQKGGQRKGAKVVVEMVSETIM